MDFHRIYDDGLAQGAYLVACGGTGEALIVDPLRDVDQWMDYVRSKGYRVVGIFETHTHADFLSGAPELAYLTGAPLYISSKAELDYSGMEQLDVRKLGDGDEVKAGNIALRALFTPGHTPEHLSYLALDHGEARFLFTGDFVFVDDLGRPDLLETTGIQAQEATDELARQLFASLQGPFAELPDAVVIWPGHGAGSPCGKSMGALPATSVGWEREHSWWSAPLREGAREAFVEELLDAQPETPTYFRRMKEINGAKRSLMTSLPGCPRHFAKDVEAHMEAGGLVVDLRSAEAFAAGHIPGAYSLPSLKKLSEHAGWVLSPDAELLLIAESSQVDEAVRRLVRVGLDRVVGYVAPEDAQQLAVRSFARISVGEAKKRIDAGGHVLDVRGASDFAEGHLPSAVNVHFGQVTQRLEEVPAEGELIVHCATGVRASIAVSQLLRAGRERVTVMPAGPSGWTSAGHELVQ